MLTLLAISLSDPLLRVRSIQTDVTVFAPETKITNFTG
jgi:hypothetical protein